MTRRDQRTDSPDENPSPNHECHRYARNANRSQVRLDRVAHAVSVIAIESH
jgi:hypothetical protein